MNSIYLTSRDKLAINARSKIIEAQRRWIEVRDACGADRQCLSGAYDQRLRELDPDPAPAHY